MRIIIAGRAKTGTTVISKTIASGAGISNYHLEPKRIDFFVSSRNVNTTSSAVKLITDHWSTRPRLRNAIIHNELPMTFDKKVVILRDFRDEILSRALYLSFAWAQTDRFDPDTAQDWIKLLQSKEKDPQAVSFDSLATFLKDRIGYDAWSLPDLSGYVHFLRQLPKDAHVIRYEDFIAGRNGELEQYLGFGLPASRSVGSELGRTLRTGGTGGWACFFTAGDRPTLKRRYQAILAEFGYDNWDSTDAGSIDPSVCSEYARRLILEARPGSV